MKSKSSASKRVLLWRMSGMSHLFNIKRQQKAALRVIWKKQMKERRHGPWAESSQMNEKGWDRKCFIFIGRGAPEESRGREWWWTPAERRESRRLSEKPRSGRSYLGAGQVAHHEVGVLQSVVLVVVVTRGGGALGAEGRPARAPAVILGVKRIHDDRLRALDFTAAERAGRPLALRLLWCKKEKKKKKSVLPSMSFFFSGQSITISLQLTIIFVID